MAIARIKTERCDGSPYCPASLSCPVGAISRRDDGTYQVEAKTCLGCGKCALFCKGKAIVMV